MFRIGCLLLVFKKQAPKKITWRLDPEGGHMFIEEFIIVFFPTPKVVVYV